MCLPKLQRFRATLTHLSGDVPGDLNVADDVSCSIPVQQLIGRWKQGPESLRLLEEEWSQNNSTANLNEVEKEHRKAQPILLTCSTKVIDYKKFSNWRKLVRTSTYMLRFIWNLRTRCQAKKSTKDPEHQIQSSRGPLTPQELEKAVEALIFSGFFIPIA